MSRRRVDGIYKGATIFVRLRDSLQTIPPMYITLESPFSTITGFRRRKKKVERFL